MTDLITALIANPYVVGAAGALVAQRYVVPPVYAVVKADAVAVWQKVFPPKAA